MGRVFTGFVVFRDAHRLLFLINHILRAILNMDLFAIFGPTDNYIIFPQFYSFSGFFGPFAGIGKS